ncbi:hypothetical protein [Nonomuraea maritima]|uniref:hypothetical protein n=1 Tax=Nonomuraea maritima TaxID=683260 RepID=UPI00372240EA
MNQDETRAYYNIPEHAAHMCSVLMDAHPDWTVWRVDDLWHARYKTWPPNRSISDTNAGLLSQTIRLGGTVS